MGNLHELPKFQDRWSHLYVEHGRLDVEKSSLLFLDKEGQMRIPIDQLAFLMLGPGTRISHAAMRSLADNNCLVSWTGEQGVRLYAHNTGGTHSSRRLLRQAELWSNRKSRMQVVRRMYQKRFFEELSENLNVEQIRSKEGQRVRREYKRIADEVGVDWQRRAYNQDDWRDADSLNRALSAANSCLYGICHAAILSAGYSPAIGFVHTGNMLSFVFDIADLYKTELSVPIAFQTAKESELDLERRTRIACRDAFYDSKLMSRIIPDIAEVLDARDDIAEYPGEFEGRAVSMAR
ncbi:type I-E CRISPR-associated endonuclease Cas1 [bacterium]|nr:type I-E CRISPR-associated endonuclease Cas1 [bacterium]